MHTIEKKQGKIHNTGKYEREREGSMLEEGPGVGMLNRILGEKVRDKRAKYGDEDKYGIRKCRRKRKYVGGKGRGM